jgi:hypothetical protein
MSFDLDASLLVLKFAGILLSGLFGILGLVVNFRDGSGRVTPWGKRALIGIIASVVVAALTQAFEYLKSAEESKAGARRTERLLSEIYRAVHPIKAVSATFCVVAPKDNAQVAVYMTKLLKTFDKLSKSYPDDWDHEGVALIRGKKRELSAAIVRPKSEHLPSAPKDGAVAFALGHVTLGVSFSKKAPDYTALAQEKPYEPDLRMMFLSDFADTGNQLIYRFDTGRIGIYAQSVDTDPKYWMSTGAITSIPDLKGSTMIVHLTDSFVYEPARTEITEIRKRLDLRYLVLNMTDGRRFFLSSKQMSKFSDALGLPYYVFEFPNSEDNISNSLKHNSLEEGCPDDFEDPNNWIETDADTAHPKR